MTSRQEEYLMLFASRNGQSRSISEAAESFRVTKPTACNACARKPVPPDGNGGKKEDKT